MILVTITGKVGSEASRLLAKRGVPVRVLAHHQSKAAALAEAGVDIVEGDLAVSESIDVAMQGVSSVVLVSPAIPARELNVIESGMQAGGAGVGMQNFLMLARAVASSGSFASCTEKTYRPLVPSDSATQTRHGCSRTCSAGRSASVRSRARNRSKR